MNILTLTEEIIDSGTITRVDDRDDIKLWRLDIIDPHHCTIDIEAQTADQARQKLIGFQTLV